MGSNCLLVAPSAKGLRQAVDVVRNGGVVAFPTETYYGLAVDPHNARAVDSLFQVKGRGDEKPILLLIVDPRDLRSLVQEVPEQYEALMAKFWPGPLTLVFPAAAGIPSRLLGGTGTVGVRISPHLVARNFCHAFGGPLTATSANLSGQTPARTAQEVAQQFGSRLDLIIDGGETSGESGSTVIGLKEGHLQLIRPGRVEYSLIRECFRPAGRGHVDD